MSPLWDTDGRVHLIEETEAQLPKWLTDSHSKKGSGRPGRGPHCRSRAVLSSSQGDVTCSFSLLTYDTAPLVSYSCPLAKGLSPKARMSLTLVSDSGGGPGKEESAMLSVRRECRALGREP